MPSPALPVRKKIIIFFLLAAACSRDLQLAPAREPPVVSDVQPHDAFAGEILAVLGKSLGSPLTSSVRVGGKQAVVLPDALDGGLKVLMPEDLPLQSPLEIRVATAEGEGVLAADAGVTYDGLGHPKGLSLRATVPLSAQISALSISSNHAFARDDQHDLLFELDPQIGASVVNPVAIGEGGGPVFGNDTSQWAYADGLPGTPPSLLHLDYSQGNPVRGCKISLTELSTESSSTIHGGGTSDGAFFAAPTGEGAVLVADLSSCPPSTTVVPVTDASVVFAAVAVQGGEVIGFTSDRFFRILPDHATVVFGPALPSDAVPLQYVQPVVSPTARKLAYARGDSDIGFVAWDAAGSAPQVLADEALTYEPNVALGWGAAGDQLYVIAQSGRVLIYTLAPGTAVTASAAVALPSPTAVVGIPTGEALVAVQGGTVLLSPDGVLLRNRSIRSSMPLQNIAITNPDRPIVPTLFGLVELNENLLGSVTFRKNDGSGYPLRMDGVQAGPGGAAGWISNVLYLHDDVNDEWPESVTLPADRVVQDASLQAEKKWVVAFSAIPTGALLDLAPLPSGALQTLALPADADGRVIFAGDAVWSAMATEGTFALQRYQPGSLVPDGAASPLPLPSSFSLGVVSGMWWSHALSAVLVVVGLPAVAGNLVNGNNDAWLFAMRTTGEQSSLHLPPTLINPIGLSADGRMLLGGTRNTLAGQPASVDAVLVSWGPDGLAITDAGHSDLPADPWKAEPVSTGDRYFVTFPTADSMGMLQ